MTLICFIAGAVCGAAALAVWACCAMEGDNHDD